MMEKSYTDMQLLYSSPREEGSNGYLSSDDNDIDGLDRNEIEIALYSQIHFDTNETAEASDSLQNTVEAPEGCGDDNDVAEKFMIDVQGNDKVGFQTGLRTADYVTNDIIEAEYGTSLQLTDGKEEQRFEKKTFLLHSQPAALDEKTIEKEVKLRNKRKSTKLNKSKNLAEQLILQAGTSSGSEDLDSEHSADSTNTDSDSDDDLIDLDIEDNEDDSGLFVNVSRNQRPLLESYNVNDWTIDENDIPDYTSKLNKSRYYKPINVNCHNCDKIGHLSKNCPQPKKAQTCGFCSESGHHMKICPDAFCYNCEEPGHIAKECGQPKKKWFTQCARCSMQGHRKSKCPDQWRQYHKTVDGKKLIREKKKVKQRNAFCYNCAGDDHLGHECEEERMDRYSQPSYPFICNYVPINYHNSEMERDFPSHKEAEQWRKHSDKNSDKKTMNVSHSFVKKDTLPNTTGRNNFDKLLFSSNKNRESINRTSTPYSTKKKKQPNSSHIIFDDSLFSTSKLENDFKFGFKSPVRSDLDSPLGDKKRKVDADGDSPTKKQKVLDSANIDKELEIKSGKKRNIERDNTDSPKRSKMGEKDSLGTVSITVTNQDNDKSVGGSTQKMNKKVVDNSSKKDKIKDKFKKKRKKTDKGMKNDSKREFDTFKDEINVTVSNNFYKEADFPRGGKKKKDSFCDEISVSFVNNLAKSGNERKSDRGFIKTKKFESVVNNSDESGEEINHQAYNNEWWLKEKKNRKRERYRKRKERKNLGQSS